MDQLMVQVDEGGPRPCGVEGECLVEVWRRWEGAGCCGARPFEEGCAPVAYLIGRGLKPLGGLVISSFSFMQLRVDEI
jgi:hypothetical protein